MNALVQLKNIKKHYKMDGFTVKALNNINLEIYNGEYTAIVGPSGSGKSTLMHIIGCLDKATEGNYYLDSKDISQLSPKELAHIRNKKIGFVFQSFNLLKKTPAWKNVELPLIYSQMRKKKRKTLAIKRLEQVGLGDRANHHSNQLSGGQQQRVAIARALVNDPKIILADEPTGNLDSKSGHEIIRLLESLNKEGKTIIVVTHDMEMAKETKRIIKLKDGHIIEDKKT